MLNKIFWIPTNKWSYIYYVFLVIAIFRINISAADNLFQTLIVILSVVSLFNIIPFQIIRFFNYIISANKNNYLKNFIRFIFVLIILGILFLFFYPTEDNKLLINYCADEKYSEYFQNKQSQGEIETFLSMRQSTKIQDEDYQTAILLCEEMYKIHKEEFIKEFSK